MKAGNGQVIVKQTETFSGVLLRNGVVLIGKLSAVDRSLFAA